MMDDWLALTIGNSRLHWGWFRGDWLRDSFHTAPLCQGLTQERLREILPFTVNYPSIPLIIASVVPQQTEYCLTYPDTQVIGLEQIPLLDLYPTLGIDRALAVFSAGRRYTFPCLVLDAGTGLTFTGVDGERRLVGGAILPGLRLQFQSLGNRTAALPLISLPEKIPPIWGRNTRQAIESGILHTTLAGIEKFLREWWILYPDSAVVITGGDASFLWRLIERNEVILDENLVFRGMAMLRSERMRSEDV
jgi:type III pantothenate kinase